MTFINYLLSSSCTSDSKRCLIRVLKDVSKRLKEHLLQAKQVSPFDKLDKLTSYTSKQGACDKAFSQGLRIAFIKL